MVKKDKKRWYAVIHGRSMPVICHSWAIACPLVTGFPGNKFKGFKTLSEAREYMQEHGTINYEVTGFDNTEAPQLQGAQSSVYAVANGRETIICQTYNPEAKSQVHNYSHACHKALKTDEQAIDFINDYIKTCELIKDSKSGKVEADDLAAVFGKLKVS